MRAALVLLAVLACNDPRSTTGTEPRALEAVAGAAGAQPTAVSAAPSTARSNAPWFAGRWQGSYQVALHRIERPSVQVAWVRDDGQRFAGEGTLSLEVDEVGRIRGTAEGALGSQRLVGSFDRDAVTFELAGPPSPDALSGLAACRLPSANGELVCTVRATSGDGNFVRAGSARLGQVPNATP